MNDTFSIVCLHVRTVQQLAMLCQTSKAAREYLYSAAGGKHWIAAAYMVCGDEYWPPVQPNQPHADDGRYVAMLRMCPWLSVPITVDIPAVLLHPKDCFLDAIGFLKVNGAEELIVDSKGSGLVASVPPRPYESGEQYIIIDRSGDFLRDYSSSESDDEHPVEYVHNSEYLYKSTFNIEKYENEPEPELTRLSGYKNESDNEDETEDDTDDDEEKHIFFQIPRVVMPTFHVFQLPDPKMTTQEQAFLDKAKDFFSASQYYEAYTPSHAYTVHNGVVAIKLSNPGQDNDGIAFFATKNFRLLQILNQAVAGNPHVLFQAGEMWCATEHEDFDRHNILYYGPSVDKAVITRNPKIETAFTELYSGNVSKAVDILQELKCPLNTKCALRGQTLLHHAVEMDDEAAVRYLVQSGMPLNDVDKWGDTAARLASENENFSIGVPLNDVTAARLASENKKFSIAKFLEEAAQNPTLP